jgi:hypothetical protein
LIKLSLAPDCIDETRTFRVIHPFHPLRGQEFLLATYRHNWSEDRVYFHDHCGNLTSLPAAWTDILPPDPFVVMSAGRAAFRVTDLLELISFLEQFHAGVPENEKDKV